MLARVPQVFNGFARFCSSNKRAWVEAIWKALLARTSFDADQGDKMEQRSASYSGGLIIAGKRTPAHS